MVLLIENDEGMSVRVDPNWRNHVEPADLDFLEELIGDFALRAKSDPESLFAQAQALGVGPLVTQTVGVFSAEDQDIFDLMQRSKLKTM